MKSVVMAPASGGVMTFVSPGAPLRLKRRAQKELVVRRARELAESGQFEGWQGIAFQLHFFDGFFESSDFHKRSAQERT